MAGPELFANAYTTTLSGPISSADTTLTVNDAPPPPLIAAGQFRAIIDQEYVLISAVGGANNTTWTVARGQEGSPAAGHSAGAQVAHALTAGALAGFITTRTATGFTMQPAADVVPLTITNPVGTAPLFQAQGTAATMSVSASGVVSVGSDTAVGHIYTSEAHLGSRAVQGQIRWRGAAVSGVSDDNVWVSGLDDGAAPANRDLVLAARVFTDTTVGDFLYIAHGANQNRMPRLGVGGGPSSADPVPGVVQSEIWSGSEDYANFVANIGVAQTGAAFAVVDVTDTTRLQITSLGHIVGNDATTGGLVIDSTRVDLSGDFYVKAKGTYLVIGDVGVGVGIAWPNGPNLYKYNATTLRSTFALLLDGNIGVNGRVPPTQPTVTGSRGGNVALANLLTSLANYGFIVDGTSS